MTFYADYLLRAGATVVPMRPVGRQINEVCSTTISAGVTFTGAWSDSTTGARYYDEDYGAVADAVPYRFASTSTPASETATATYTPNIPAAGLLSGLHLGVARHQPHDADSTGSTTRGGQTRSASITARSATAGCTSARITSTPAARRRYGSVQISNNSAGGGTVVIADAIRFGNGMGDLRTATAGSAPADLRLSARGREFLPLADRGCSASGTTPIGTGASATTSRRPSNMAEYMYQNANPFGDACTSASTPTAPATPTRRRPAGAVGLITTSGATPHQSDLALYPGPADQPGHAEPQRRVRTQLEHADDAHVHQRLRRDRPRRRRRDGRHDHRGRVPRQRARRRAAARPEGPRSDRALDLPGNARVFRQLGRPDDARRACRRRRRTCAP